MCVLESLSKLDSVIPKMNSLVSKVTIEIEVNWLTSVNSNYSI